MATFILEDVSTAAMVSNLPKIDIVPTHIAHIKIPRLKKKLKLTDIQRKTYRRYRDAYKAVFGVPPEVKYDGKWFRIKGQTAGINRMRLAELAKQLEYRAGG